MGNQTLTSTYYTTAYQSTQVSDATSMTSSYSYPVVDRTWTGITGEAVTCNASSSLYQWGQKYTSKSNVNVTYMTKYSATTQSFSSSVSLGSDDDYCRLVEYGNYNSIRPIDLYNSLSSRSYSFQVNYGLAKSDEGRCPVLSTYHVVEDDLANSSTTYQSEYASPYLFHESSANYIGMSGITTRSTTVVTYANSTHRGTSQRGSSYASVYRSNYWRTSETHIEGVTGESTFIYTRSYRASTISNRYELYTGTFSETHSEQAIDTYYSGISSSTYTQPWGITDPMVKITWDGIIGYYRLTSSYTDQPYLMVSDSYLPLSTNTTNLVAATQPKINLHGMWFRPLRFFSHSTSTTYYTTAERSWGLTDTSYATRASTSGTSYLTRESTSGTSYLTCASTSGTDYETEIQLKNASLRITYMSNATTGSASKISRYTTYQAKGGRLSFDYNKTTAPGGLSSCQFSFSITGPYFETFTEMGSSYTNNEYISTSESYSHKNVTYTGELINNNVFFIPTVKIQNDIGLENMRTQLTRTAVPSLAVGASITYSTSYTRVWFTFLARQSNYTTITTNTIYYTRSSTSGTSYLTRESTSGTSYLTCESTYGYSGITEDRATITDGWM